MTPAGKRSARVFLFVLCAFLFLTCASAARPSFEMCMPVLSPKDCLHFLFAVNYFSRDYPLVDWKAKLIGYTTTNSPSLSGVVRGFIINGTSCNGLIGPEASSFSVAMSPVVNIPWISMTATSQELSDKASHPYFSRVMPTDAMGAGSMAALFNYFGWKTINILSTDDPYSRSVTTGMASKFSSYGGRVDVSASLQQSATRAEVETVINAVLASPSRIFFVSATFDTLVFTHVLNIARDRHLGKVLIFAFPETVCSDSSWNLVPPGSLCATYTYNAAAFAQYRTAILASDVTAYVSTITGMGFSAPSPTQNDLYSVYTIEALRHLMGAMQSFLTGNATSSDPIQHLRQYVSVGWSGPIQMDSNGDRPAADLIVFNSFANGTAFPMIISNFTIQLQPIQTGFATRYYFLGSAVDTPAGDAFTKDSSSEFPAWAIVIIVLLVAVLASTALWRFMVWRRTQYAPKDPSCPVFVMFVVVKGLAALWDRIPNTLPSVLDDYETFIKDSIASSRCYQARKIGDCYMVVTHDAAHAASFCATLQERVIRSSLSRKLRDAFVSSPNQSRVARSIKPSSDKSNKDNKSNKDTASDTTSDRAAVESLVFKIGIGMHVGLCRIKTDAESGVLEYSGPVVDEAAECADNAVGSQVLLTPEARNAIVSCSSRPECAITEFAVRKLRGIDKQLWALRTPTMPTIAEKDVALKAEAEASESALATLQSATCGFSLNRIAVAYIRVNVRELTTDAAGEYEAVSGTIFKAALEHKGVAWAVAEGEFIITFNAFGVLASRVRKAVLCALSVVAELGQSSTPKRNVTCGIAAGSEVAGNVRGTNAHRAVIGGVVGQARALELLCRRFPEEHILAPHTMVEEFNTVAYYQWLTFVQSPNGRTAVITILNEREEGQDEWMYALQKDPYHSLNAAYEQYFASGSVEPLHAALSNEEMHNEPALASALARLRGRLSDYERDPSCWIEGGLTMSEITA